MRTAAFALLLALLPACATGPGASAPDPGSAAVAAPGEPVFDGKPLAYWLAEMRDLSSGRREAACRAVQTFGRLALPGIIEVCSSEFPRVRRDAVDTLAYISFDHPSDPEVLAVLLAATKDPDEGVREKAAQMLHYQNPLPPEARAALESLRDGDPSEWVRRQAGTYLENLATLVRGEE